MQSSIAILMLGGLGAILLGIVLAEILVRGRAARQRALLWVLTAATERFIPLVPAVEAFARQRGGQLRARRLATMLADGMELPQALDKLPGLVPPEALPIIHVGQKAGTLAGALRHVAAARDSDKQLWLSLAGKLLYLCGLVFFGIIILGFILVYIVPSFVEIFQDYELQLPLLTVVMIFVSNSFMTFWFLFLPLFLALFLLLIYTALRFEGCIRWDLPGFVWVTRRLDTAVILDALSLAAGQRYPLRKAIEILTRSYHKASIRSRLLDVLRDMDAGADWCESLLRQGLIRPADMAVLQAAGRAGNLSWAMSEMADSSRRRLAYRMYALMQLCYPPVILALGAVVMFFVVSLFVPLIALIQNLT